MLQQLSECWYQQQYEELRSVVQQACTNLCTAQTSLAHRPRQAQLSGSRHYLLKYQVPGRYWYQQVLFVLSYQQGLMNTHNQTKQSHSSYELIFHIHDTPRPDLLVVSGLLYSTVALAGGLFSGF